MTVYINQKVMEIDVNYELIRAGMGFIKALDML